MIDQNIAGKHFIGRCIHEDSAIIHDDDAIHIPMQNIFDSVFNDDACLVRLAIDIINQLDRFFTRGRIKVGKRFIKQKNVDIIYHDTA